MTNKAISFHHGRPPTYSSPPWWFGFTQGKALTTLFNIHPPSPSIPHSFKTIYTPNLPHFSFPCNKQNNFHSKKFNFHLYPRLTSMVGLREDGGIQFSSFTSLSLSLSFSLAVPFSPSPSLSFQFFFSFVLQWHHLEWVWRRGCYDCSLLISLGCGKFTI